MASGSQALGAGGSYGQLIGVLLFVYASLASAGGTVPVEALSGFLRVLSNVEPLRQVLAGTRSILYFNAQGDAGLTQGVLATAVGLVFWLVAGTVIVKWYDRRRFCRMHPDVLAHVSRSVQDYKVRQAAPGPADPGASSGPDQG